MKMTINICGIPHEIVECDDTFNNGDCGMIDHITGKIKMNSKLSKEIWKETLCHEIVHGMLVHLGYNNLSSDETLVQGLANAIYQSFDIKGVE